MKRSFILFFLISSVLASARTYYVSPTGIDGPYPTRGTFENPWKTWHYAFNNTTPGDTCYFRGGVYQPYSPTIGANLNTASVDGTHDNPTCFFAYPADYDADNHPILDCSTMNVNKANIGISISRCSHIYFKGLTVRNLFQVFSQGTTAEADAWRIWSEYSATNYFPNNIRLENCTAYNIGKHGFSVSRADSVHFINCDAYNIVDTINYDPGGGGTGFTFFGSTSSFPNAADSYVYFYGCRAWKCSDQGYSTSTPGKVIFDHCWAIRNGDNYFCYEHNGTTYGNRNPTVIPCDCDVCGDRKGSGWKLWYPNEDLINSDIVQIEMKNCIGAYNAYRAVNWTSETPILRSHIYNNFFYGTNYSEIGWSAGENISDPAKADTSGTYDKLYYNNISYDCRTNRDNISGIINESHNYFNVSGSPVQNSWFLSLDTTGICGPRQRNGSLPDIPFGKPAPGSPLIDAGAKVFDIEYNGLAPDIGWVESSYGSSAVPTYVSSVIENATPSRIEITYNLTLANIVPATSAFTVTINGSVRTVSSVSVSGTKVLLTLTSTVVYGDVVTVAYTKPVSNPLQTAAGGQAASFSAKSVTNNVAAVIPVYVSSAVENSTPSRIDLTFNLTLANIVPATSAFTVTINGSVRTVSSVSVSGTKVLLTLISPVVYGDVVTVAYTKPVSNPLQTAAGGQAASFTAKSVTNNVEAVIPVYISSVVENSTPSRIDLTFNLTLANIVPAPSAFTVIVNGSARTVSSVSVSGTKVLLTLASPVVYGDVVTVAYTKPLSNQLQTAADGQAASFTAKSVTNNVGAINQPPTVNISSPTKSNSFIAPATITIEAVASDPNGPVAKVEFYQGTVKLGELTSAPYSYTWKEVPEGSYSITAAATDSQGLRTVSAAVTVVVEKSSTHINQIPVVGITITNKKKPKKHDDVVIVAEANDPDGTITKVELKNGDVIIAETATVPYVFTLRDIDTGTYQFTAIATDNLGATNSSQTVELKVEDYYDGSSEIVILYPNPNEGQFKLDFLTDLTEEDNRISIFNSSGNIIYNESVTGEENLKEIRLNNSTPGTYILMITSGKTILATKKFIINR